MSYKDLGIFSLENKRFKGGGDYILHKIQREDNWDLRVM